MKDQACQHHFVIRYFCGHVESAGSQDPSVCSVMAQAPPGAPKSPDDAYSCLASAGRSQVSLGWIRRMCIDHLPVYQSIIIQQSRPEHTTPSSFS